jgi:hypothetical protein
MRQAVKINSKFATPEDIGRRLGIPPLRVRELKKMVEISLGSVGASRPASKKTKLFGNGRSVPSAPMKSRSGKRSTKNINVSRNRTAPAKASKPGR